MLHADASRTEDRPEGSGQRRIGTPERLTYLLLLLLAAMVLFAYSLPRDRALTDWIQRRRDAAARQRWLVSVRQADPRIGTRMLANRGGDSLAEALAQRVHGRPPALLFIGSCTKCVGRALLQWEAAVRGSGHALIIVSRDSPGNIARFRATTDLSLPIVPDPTGELSRRFNAAWTPRAYRLDSTGRLAWIQADDTLQPIQAAAMLWRE